MKVFFLAICSSLTLAQDDTINSIIENSGNFLEGYELVPKSVLKSIEGLTKCGEGVLRNRFVCVPYYNCDVDTNTVIANPSIDGSTRIDIRFGEENSKCEHYLEVCCQVANTPTGIGTTIPNPLNKNPTEIPKTIIGNSRPNTTANCGIRNAQGIDFNFLGGTNEANFGEFPWMVAILRKNQKPSETLSLCGGSIIGPRVILTGAHCVDSVQPQHIKVRAGEWDTQTENERIQYQERNVAQIIIHEGYISAKRNLFNNAALLILERSFAKTDSVGTVCLPQQNQVINSKNCFASGWGKTSFGEEGLYAVILKKIKLPTVPHKNCEEALRKTRLKQSFILHNSFMCAGGEADFDTCTGDGGSPLVCPDPNHPGRYVQAGIVAWGIGCRDGNIPGVYADVSKFRNWIDSKLRQKNINTNSYIL